MAARDHTKLKELMLYIAERCQFRHNFGATMLNKILFFSDFISYARYGEPITGEDYFKLDWGPAPKYLLEAREELEREGAIITQVKKTWRGDQTRIVPKDREADLSVFDARQISLVDSIVDELKDESAKSVSGLSHKFYGWQITPDRETIPYETVFLREPKPKTTPKNVRDRIDRLVQQHGPR